MNPKIALLFPGQGSQTLGMAKDFCENFRTSAQLFEEAEDHLRLSLRKICFDGPMDVLTQTEILQPALFTVAAAMLAGISEHTDLRPQLVAGHSLGEYSALFAAKAIAFKDAVLLTRMRGAAMQRAVPLGVGSMCALMGLNGSQADALCRLASQNTGKVVEPANYNSPGQIVLAGHVEAIQEVNRLAKSDTTFAGSKLIPLTVSAPFHCSLMQPARLEMENPLSKTHFSPLICPILPNATARPTQSNNEIPSLLIEQITNPVLWEQSMVQLRALDITSAVEIGPGRVLTGLMKRIDRDFPIKTLNTIDQLKEIFPS